jgi:pimeloyl-ACP methyl ester carboxylesterase
VVVGHSIGGVMTLAAAARRPDLVRAVVAYEAPMQWEPWWPADSAGGDAIAAVATGGPPAVAERFLRRMVGDDRWNGLPEETKAIRRAEGEALVADLHSVRSVAPYDPAALPMPVVSGCGSASKPYHQRAARELADAVPDGELVTIGGATHGAHQSHPQEFAGLVRRALARVS